MAGFFLSKGEISYYDTVSLPFSAFERTHSYAWASIRLLNSVSADEVKSGRGSLTPDIKSEDM